MGLPKMDVNYTVKSTIDSLRMDLLVVAVGNQQQPSAG